MTQEGPATVVFGWTRYTVVPLANRRLSTLTLSVEWLDGGSWQPATFRRPGGSAIASLEGQYALKHKNLTSFSEQDLVDCVVGVEVNGGECCEAQHAPLMRCIALDPNNADSRTRRSRRISR